MRFSAVLAKKCALKPSNSYSSIFCLRRVWKRTYENIQNMKIRKWMKVNENETRRQSWNCRRMEHYAIPKHLRPPRRGLFLRCWSLLQASCLLSASLCLFPRFAPRAIIIFFSPTSVRGRASPERPISLLARQLCHLPPAPPRSPRLPRIPDIASVLPSWWARSS